MDRARCYSFDSRGSRSGDCVERSSTAPRPAPPEPVKTEETTAPASPVVAGIPIKSFAFDMVATDAKAAVTGRSRGEAKYFAERPRQRSDARYGADSGRELFEGVARHGKIQIWRTRPAAQ